MITNPIIPGFNPDPCICRKGEDYYLVEADTESLSGMGETQRESRILRGGDEVILTASDLYDGKVIDE